jgi:hypothetical protein
MWWVIRWHPAKYIGADLELTLSSATRPGPDDGCEQSILRLCVESHAVQYLTR